MSGTKINTTPYANMSYQGTADISQTYFGAILGFVRLDFKLSTSDKPTETIQITKTAVADKANMDYISGIVILDGTRVAELSGILVDDNNWSATAIFNDGLSNFTVGLVCNDGIIKATIYDDSYSGTVSVTTITGIDDKAITEQIPTNSFPEHLWGIWAEKSVNEKCSCTATMIINKYTALNSEKCTASVDNVYCGDGEDSYYSYSHFISVIDDTEFIIITDENEGWEGDQDNPASLFWGYSKFRAKINGNTMITYIYGNFPLNQDGQAKVVYENIEDIPETFMDAKIFNKTFLGYSVYTDAVKKVRK